MERRLPAAEAPRATSWLERLRRWDGEPLSPEESVAFAAETTDRDIRRLKVLAPLMAILHLTHIWLYRVPAEARETLTPTVLRWQDHVVWVHVATLPLTLLILGVAYRRPQSRLGRMLMPITATAYLVHGAMATGVDQIVLGNVAAFTGYSYGVAVFVGFPLAIAAWVYGIGFSVLVMALFAFQADPAARISNLLNVATVVTMSLAISMLIDAARRRDFVQRRTIARQRDELADLNTDLERRVDEQVAEIVRRANEVNHLNAQLRSQIRARSSELSMALSKLATQRGEDGLLRPGVVLGERFEIGEPLGKGGMGVVYSGRDRVTDATVAIKVIQATNSTELDAMRRFLGEAGAVASITHPAVVRMIHVDVSEDGLLYQAQERIDGETLEHRLGKEPWPEADVARLAAVLCEALAAAHARGVIHRDVKPGNVMLTREAPGLKLLDFGLAKLHGAAKSDDPEATGIGLVVGTPAYMAPEQALAMEITDKADVYAVGVLLFQMLTGQHVFELEGPSRVMRSHVATAPPDVRTVRPDIAEQLALLISACLAKEPADRPTAAEVAHALRTVADASGAPPLEELIRRSAAEVTRRQLDAIRGRMGA